MLRPGCIVFNRVRCQGGGFDIYKYISIANRNEQHGGYPLLWRELISFENAQHDDWPRWGLWRGKWFGLRNADGPRCLMAKMSQNGMKKYIAASCRCIFIHIFLIILIQLYTCTMNHYDLYALNIWWENERKTYRHPQSKKLTMLGYLMIWGMPVAWAFGAAMWVAHLQFQLDELFFSETTHTLWDVCFVEFLWGKWFSLLKRFFGWLPPTVLYIYLPVPGGTNHFRPTVSAHFSPSLLWFPGAHRACVDGLFACLLDCHLRLFTSFSSRGCSTFCYHCFLFVCLPIFAVLCSAVFRKCPERQVRSSKHIQKCSLEGFPKCHLLNLKSISISRNIPINCGQCIIAERTYSKKTIHPYNSTLQKIKHGILWTYFRSPISSSILFHLISVPGRQNRSGCPTSGAWWPVTPGKASATRVVQKWIGAPDPPVKLKEAPP